METGETTPDATEAAPPRVASAFLLLFGLALLAAVDRWAFAPLASRARAELKFSAGEASWLSAWALIGFTAACPALAYFGNPARRPRLLAAGAALCGLATIACGLAQSYGQLRAARGALGAGEAVVIVVALAVLADLVPRPSRSAAFAGFFLTVPLGAAIGLGVGGALGDAVGWRAGLAAVGTAGLLAAGLGLLLPDPLRGQAEGVAFDRLKAHEKAGATRDDAVDLMVNSSYTYSVLGMAFLTFAVGGFATGLPSFLTVVKGVAPEVVAWRIGEIGFAAAVVGIGVGGWLIGRVARSRPRALFVMPGLAALAAVPAAWAAIFSGDNAWVFAGAFLAGALMFAHLGPCHAVIADVSLPTLRLGAFAVGAFAVHAIGDLWSPTLTGWVADTFGRGDAMATPFGQAFAAMGALPRPMGEQPPENMTAGLLAMLPALVLAGAVWLAAARHFPRERALMLANLKAPPKADRPRRPAPGG